MHIEGRRIVIEPVEEALQELSSLIVEVSVKASVGPSRLSELASIQLVEDVGNAP